jgi:hypothetical protein
MAPDDQDAVAQRESPDSWQCNVCCGRADETLDDAKTAHWVLAVRVPRLNACGDARRVHAHFVTAGFGFWDAILELAYVISCKI